MEEVKILNEYIVLETEDILKYLEEPDRITLECFLNKISKGRTDDNKNPSPQYYICNTDEIYAPSVYAIIRSGEGIKESLRRISKFGVNNE